MEIKQAREAQARQQAADAARAAIDEDSEEAVDAATYEVRTWEAGSAAHLFSVPKNPLFLVVYYTLRRTGFYRNVLFGFISSPPFIPTPLQARRMDEWKDEHRRGEGNRHNKG